MPFAHKAFIPLFLLAIAFTAASAQPSFSIKTNSDFPTLGTDFGYRAGKIEPYIGISNYSFHLKSTTSYAPNTAGFGDTSDATASMFITSIGLRIGLRDEGVKPYIFANLYKLFTLVDSKGNSAKEDDAIEQLYSPFGFGVGFGAEYSVVKNFGVFGEYGFRALFPGSKQTTDNGGGALRTEEVSALFSALSGSAGIRFYF